MTADQKIPAIAWTIQKARDTYNIAHWSGGYFDINAKGHLICRPDARTEHPGIDMFELSREIKAAGLSLPVLVRFSDILRHRVETLCGAFDRAMKDVKPANIMVSEEIGTGDHVRILDFGLARLRGAPGRDATQANVVVGTPNYMAPEQTVGGGLIDARTDIYAAGVVLFEMITGERPFQADDTLALLGMHRAAPIPGLAERLPPDVQLPHGLQDIIDRAMAKSPGDRFQSAIEFAEAIDRVSGGRPATDSGSPSSFKSRILTTTRFGAWTPIT